MVRVFVSQPMKNKSEERIRDERQRITDKLNDRFVGQAEIINKFNPAAYTCMASQKNAPLAALGQSLILMSTADVVFFARGWKEARGCRIENQAAIEYGLTVIEDYEEDTHE